GTRAPSARRHTARAGDHGARRGGAVARELREAAARRARIHARTRHDRDGRPPAVAVSGPRRRLAVLLASAAGYRRLAGRRGGGAVQRPATGGGAKPPGGGGPGGAPAGRAGAPRPAAGGVARITPPPL